jgi:hypothetical protein
MKSIAITCTSQPLCMHARQHGQICMTANISASGREGGKVRIAYC